MKLTRLWVWTVVLLPSTQTIAQEKPKRLYIGDKVPDIEFKGMYNYPRKTAKLSDFKGKAVILDFWNKGCSSCIAYFPKMQRLQEEFKHDIVVLLVNDAPEQTWEALNPRFRTSAILRSTKLPMVLGDENYKYDTGLFPHYAVPYHVWIDKNGIIRATTSAEEATRENIGKFIKGEQLDVIKEMHVFGKIRDDKTGWLSYENGLFINNLLYYRSDNFNYRKNSEDIDLSPLRQFGLGEQSHSMLMKEPHAGLKVGGSNGQLIDSNGKEIGCFSRGPIGVHYRRAFGIRLEPIIVEGGEALDLRDEFVYEYTHSNYNRSLFKKTYQQDLENYFRFSGKEELRSVECYILYRTDGALKLTCKGGPQILENTRSKQGIIIRNMDFGVLRNSISDSDLGDKFGNLPVIIDETGIDRRKKVDMTIHGDLQNLQKLNRSLSAYGLAIRKDQKLLSIFILQKIK